MTDDDGNVSTSAAEGKDKRKDRRNPGTSVRLDIGVTYLECRREMGPSIWFLAWVTR